VEHHANALGVVRERGIVGETCDVGGRNERTNLHVVSTICDLLDTMEPPPRWSRRQLSDFVTGRYSHHRKYAIDATKRGRELR
jgi:dTDP-glucose 4,6-dehydratase